MFKTFRRVPRESRVLVVVSLTVLLQVLVLSAFGLSALKGQVAEGERSTREICRRVLKANLSDEVVGRIRDEEDAVRQRLEGISVPDPAGDPGLREALRSATGAGRLFRRAFVVDRRGAWYDSSLALLWPAWTEIPPAPGGDAVGPFDAVEDALTAGGDLGEAIERTRVLLESADAAARPYGSLLFARLLHRAGRAPEAIAVCDSVLEKYPVARDPAVGLPIGPALGLLRARSRLERFRAARASADAVVDDLLDLRRILLVNLHRTRGGWDEHYRDELGRLAEAAAEVEDLPLLQRSRLSDGLLRMDEEEKALLEMRGAFGTAIERVARGGEPGGRMRADGPRVVLAVPLRGDEGPTGAAVLELDLLRVRTEILPDVLTAMPLPDGVRATVLDGGGRAVVAGAGVPEGPAFETADFGDILPFWRPVVYLEDPSLLDRQSAGATRLHYWIMGLSIAGILAAGWFVVSTVKREMHVARLKSDFLSNVTHELKTPLTSIRMFVETLEEGRVKDEAERRECLGIISREADRLTGLIQRVLDLSRLEGRKAVLNIESADLRELVNDTAEIFRMRMGDSGAELEVEVEPEMPGLALDRTAVQELILNLLSNAMKYGGKRIRLSASAGNGEARITVADDGIGIDEKEQDRIFEKFHRADDRLARAVEGSGLGLALVREIARAHGGRVTVSSKRGEGSRFTVRLPLRKG